MLISYILTLAVGAVMALPATESLAAPPTTIGKAFYLKVRLADKKKDFSPSIQDNYLVINYENEQYNILSVNSGKHTRVWFLNGTKEEVAHGKGSVVDNYVDAAGSIYIGNDAPKLHQMRIAPGRHATSVPMSPPSDPYSYLMPDQYVVCDVGGQKQVKNIAPKDKGSLPSTCVPIRLYPQCHELMNPGSDTTYAQPVRCYEYKNIPPN